MDIDKLLASFQAVADEARRNEPLIAVKDLIPNRKIPGFNADDAARRFVAVFLLWLASRGWLSPSAAIKLEALSFDLSLEASSNALVQVFSDSIEVADVKPEILVFCQVYLAPSLESFGDDFHKMFVQGTNVDSYLDVVLSEHDLEAICLVVDERHRAFLSKKNAQDGFIMHTPDRVTELAVKDRAGFNFDTWRDRVRSFDNIECDRGGSQRHRSLEYLGVLDKAAISHDPRVSEELFRTYIYHSDSSVQSNVWRLLRMRPPLEVFLALVQKIVEIAEKTVWASELVDIFEDNLPNAVLDQMADQIDSQAQEVQLAYVTSLQQAERDGSKHAAQLLLTLFPSS